MAIRHVHGNFEGESAFPSDFGFHGSNLPAETAHPPFARGTPETEPPSSPSHVEAGHVNAYAHGGHAHHMHPHGHRVMRVEHHHSGVVHHHEHGGYTIHHHDGNITHHDAMGGHISHEASPPFAADVPTHGGKPMTNYAHGGHHPHGHDVVHVQHTHEGVIHHHVHGGYTMHHHDGSTTHHDRHGGHIGHHMAHGGGVEHMHDSSEYAHRGHHEPITEEPHTLPHEPVEAPETFARGGMPSIPKIGHAAVPHMGVGHATHVPRLRPRMSPIERPPRNPNLSTTPRNDAPGGGMGYGVEPSAEPDMAGSGMSTLKRGGHHEGKKHEKHEKKKER